MHVMMSGMQAFAQNVWTVDGPTVRDFGVLFTTRMTVVVALRWFSMGGFSCTSAVRDAQTHHGIGACALSCCRDPEARLAAGSVAHALSRSTALGTTPYPLTLKKGHLPLTGMLGDAPQIPTGRMTSTNLPSRAILSSRKSFSFIERLARLSWMISSKFIRE